MSELFVDVGVGITGVLAWFTSVLTSIETALGTSFLLQLIFAIAGISVGFLLLRKVVNIVKGLIR